MAFHQLIGPLHVPSGIDYASAESPIGELEGLEITLLEKLDELFDQGFEAVMVTDSAFYRNPHYHTPLDTMEKLDYRFMAELVKSLLVFFRSMGR